MGRGHVSEKEGMILAGGSYEVTDRFYRAYQVKKEVPPRNSRKNILKLEEERHRVII